MAEKKQTNEFYEAQLALYKDVEAMKKDTKNPFFNSTYIPLPKMIEALKPICEKHGFFLSQPLFTNPRSETPQNIVTSRIVYGKTGEFSSSELAIPEASNLKDMQALGGAVTYARRYTLSALFGLPETDDDGNSVSGNKSSKVRKSKGKSKSVNLEDF